MVIARRPATARPGDCPAGTVVAIQGRSGTVRPMTSPLTDELYEPVLQAGTPIEVVVCDTPFRDLAPMITRQRLVVEGIMPEPIDDQAIRDYLIRLTEVCGMTALMEPVTHCCDAYGWSGWAHWEDSGAHFYAWDRPILFFSADIYTCKSFDPQAATLFTRDYFDASEIVARAF